MVSPAVCLPNLERYVHGGVVPVTDSQETLQTSLDEWNEELTIRVLQINPNKRKVVCVGRESVESRILCGGEPL